MRSDAEAALEEAGEVASVESAVTVCFEIVLAAALEADALVAGAEAEATALEAVAPAAEPEEKKMLCEVPEARGRERLALLAGVEAAADPPETVNEFTGSPAWLQVSSSSSRACWACVTRAVPPPCAPTEQLRHWATLDMTEFSQIWRHFDESSEQLLNTVTIVAQMLWH